ncbi:hypothetical protein PSACC_01498 [Paramicrosporidium saccamoebae]|uniref:Uncharacterized protein n=1 Tax=Paramicrosporidium saccamoebae TaxID=1246581 RepID=A0A2H9TLQ6_9FUNG|nr:hypothetical protein PSACC_01498 [Paramicrosporidium saccamoebae]
MVRAATNGIPTSPVRIGRDEQLLPAISKLCWQAKFQFRWTFSDNSPPRHNRDENDNGSDENFQAPTGNI